jgi:hypothetical protein
VIDLETPAARGAVLRALGHSPSLDEAMRTAELDRLYENYLELQHVPRLLGGVIPTDLQGAYRAGWPSVATAVDAPYYHTAADTPDKVDLARLAAAVDAFDAAIDGILEHPPAAEPDPSLLQLRASAAPERLEIRLDREAPIDVTIFKDGFFPVATLHATTDRAGHVALDVPAGSFAHVSAGAPYPLAEAMVDLQNAR